MTRATRAPAPNPLNRTQSAATIGRVNLDDAGESKMKQQGKSHQTYPTIISIISLILNMILEGLKYISL